MQRTYEEINERIRNGEAVVMTAEEIIDIVNEEGISGLKRFGVSVQTLEKDIIRDEKRCTHCSVCVVHCPTGALYIEDRKTMRVEFDKSKYVLCETCVTICPVKAMSVVF